MKSSSVFPSLKIDKKSDDLNIVATQIVFDEHPVYLSQGNGPQAPTLCSFQGDVQLEEIAKALGGGEYILYATIAGSRKVLAVRVVRFKGEPTAFTKSRISGRAAMVSDREKRSEENRQKSDAAAAKLAHEDEEVASLLVEIYGALVSVGLTGSQQAAWAAMDKSRVAVEKAFMIVAPRIRARSLLMNSTAMSWAWIVGGGMIAAYYLATKAWGKPSAKPAAAPATTPASPPASGIGVGTEAPKP